MAYLRELGVNCYVTGCTKVARYELMNQYNGATGRFCPKHAKEQLARARVEERELLESRAPKPPPPKG